MEIIIIQPEETPPVPFVHSLSMVIKSFKGRRDVEVHLFRSSWETAMEEGVDWTRLISGTEDAESSRRVIMESFTAAERDRIIKYLKEQYSTRLRGIRSTPLTFPVPAGLAGLSQLTPNKSVGLIEFERIPSYSLGLPIKGLYDLNQHPPIVED
ncbi:hypothetical protein GM415_14905 [Pseudodesulfovibrio cashew]|uniref:Uncharacterized protein n=1 Tax=Pseudodesulfovibrio cashew TaxID=2678688 RepID=A0A6I6JMK1_9BACT|nr:hypothetical protein [Pseudodesulfovibrio cashew]QGY41357.1 hypothetical protein GM415_14905 [Pseudodesulfovibrio cashew]